MSDSNAHVADELAIRELVARYADAVARRDEDAWAATWTEDAEWHLLGRSASGRDAVVSLLKTLISGVPFVVQIPNSGIIQVHGETGSGRWYITEYAKTRDGAALFNLGVYHDEYRRTADEWRFSRRRFDVLYMGPPDLSARANPFPEKP
jgi:uncharacterized protein (TIGR02246 family)